MPYHEEDDRLPERKRDHIRKCRMKDGLYAIFQYGEHVIEVNQMCNGDEENKDEIANSHDRKQRFCHTNKVSTPIMIAYEASSRIMNMVMYLGVVFSKVKFAISPKSRTFLMDS